MGKPAYFDPPRYIADNPNGPSMSSKWHSHEDCPSISGIASPATVEALEFLAIAHGHEISLCGLCKRRRKG
jgi:hypothetical protein